MIASEANSHRQKGSVLVMATVLSFAMFVGGLSYLSLVDKMTKEVERTIKFRQEHYASIAKANATRAFVKINAPGHDYSTGRQNYYKQVDYEGYVKYGGSEHGLYGVNFNYVVTGNG